MSLKHNLKNLEKILAKPLSRKDTILEVKTWTVDIKKELEQLKQKWGSDELIDKFARAFIDEILGKTNFLIREGC